MIARNDRLAIRSIDKALKRNRKILWKLLDKRTEFVVRKMRLKSLGYDFKYLTHIVLIDHAGRIFAVGIYEFRRLYTSLHKY